jgi:hypothetical protein
MTVFDYYNTGEGLQGPTWIKRCRLCQDYKPLDDFHKDRSKADGLKGACKTCANLERKERGYARNK